MLSKAPKDALNKCMQVVALSLCALNICGTTQHACSGNECDFEFVESEAYGTQKDLQ